MHILIQKQRVVVDTIVDRSISEDEFRSIFSIYMVFGKIAAIKEFRSRFKTNGETAGLLESKLAVEYMYETNEWAALKAGFNFRYMDRETLRD